MKIDGWVAFIGVSIVCYVVGTICDEIAATH